MIRGLKKYCRQSKSNCDKCILNRNFKDIGGCFCGEYFLLVPEIWALKEMKRNIKKTHACD